MSESCNNCKYCKNEITGNFFCQKNAPIKSYTWPQVSKIDWCGDWKAKKGVIPIDHYKNRPCDNNGGVGLISRESTIWLSRSMNTGANSEGWTEVDNIPDDRKTFIDEVIVLKNFLKKSFKGATIGDISIDDCIKALEEVINEST